ncbi:MAG: hypothetical protein M3076_07530 [Actinomycetota bacterium]|nr:hypothetical protein [Actinomycetota bacterium]
MLRSTMMVRYVAVLVIACAGVGAKFLLAGGTGSSSSAGAPTSVSASQSAFREANLHRAISAVESKAGIQAKLLRLTLVPSYADFVLRSGQRAVGWRWMTASEALLPVQVTLEGSGTLNGQDFPLSEVSTSAPAKIVGALGGNKLSASWMALSRAVTDGVVGWNVNAGGGGRSDIAYSADAGGNRVTDVVKSASSAANQATQAASQATQAASQATQAASQSASQATQAASQAAQGGAAALKTAQKLQQCVAKANGDPNALALCTSAHASP